MRNKITLIATLITLSGLVAAFAFLFDYLSAIRSYEALREKAKSPLMELVPVDRKEQKFLDNVKSTWMINHSISPDDTMVDLCKSIDFEPTIEGFLFLCTHEIPPFSFSDKNKNIKEAGRAGALSALTELSPDGRIYHKKGLVYIKYHPQIVALYENTDKGFKRTIYSNTN